MGTQKRYTDDFRAKAVAAAIAAGYPQTKGALTRVAAELAISHQLLRNWIVGAQNPPPEGLLQEKKTDLRALFQAEMQDIMALLPNKRHDASYRELGTVLGILFDKARLLDELPTQIVGLTPHLKRIDGLAQRLGISMEQLFTDLAAQLDEEAAHDARA